MNLPPVITVPHPLLRRPLAPVTKFDQSLLSLVKTMMAVMRHAEGVGLAANQIGEDARVFVYGIEEPFVLHGKRIEAVPYQAVVNPVVTVTNSRTEELEEGCLSIPELRGPVARPMEIELSGFDQHGQPFSRRISGYEARIVQHESDHLDGKLFLDHITDPTKIYRLEE